MGLNNLKTFPFLDFLEDGGWVDLLAGNTAKLLPLSCTIIVQKSCKDLVKVKYVWVSLSVSQSTTEPVIQLILKLEIEGWMQIPN